MCKQATTWLHKDGTRRKNTDNTELEPPQTSYHYPITYRLPSSSTMAATSGSCTCLLHNNSTGSVLSNPNCAHLSLSWSTFSR